MSAGAGRVQQRRLHLIVHDQLEADWDLLRRRRQVGRGALHQVENLVGLVTFLPVLAD